MKKVWCSSFQFKATQEKPCKNGFFVYFCLILRFFFYPSSYLALIISLPISASDLNVDDLNLEMEGYGQIKAYAKSKLANILFTKELDRRYKGIE